MNMFEWLGKEFVALSGKGKAGMTPEGEAQEILQYFDGELRDLGPPRRESCNKTCIIAHQRWPALTSARLISDKWEVGSSSLPRPIS